MEFAQVQSLIALDPRIRNTGRLHSNQSYVSLVNTNNTILLVPPTGATLLLYGLWVHNRNVAAVTLALGTGAVLVQTVPLLGPFLSGFTGIDVWLPLPEFVTTIYVTSTAGAAAPNDTQVKAFAIAVGG